MAKKKTSRREFLGGALKAAIIAPLTVWFARQPEAEVEEDVIIVEDHAIKRPVARWDSPYYVCRYPPLRSKCHECPEDMCPGKLGL